MGFDVYGLGVKAPEVDWEDETSRKEYWAWQENTPGAYFRNNCWWWRPLWDYVSEVCCDILSEEDIQGGTHNSGYKITAEKAVKLAERLNLAVKTGAVKKHAFEYKQWQESLPKVRCRICGGSGQRDDEYVKGQCNACQGEGKVEPWAKSYPFDEENVVEFAKFCASSGGFEIC